jgi:hypothetical protein
MNRWKMLNNRNYKVGAAGVNSRSLHPVFTIHRVQEARG